MSNLLSALAAHRPREKAGSRTSARYEFQAHVAILKIIDLHEGGSDYRAIFDHFDDLLILNHPNNADRIRLYQIKGKGSGRWTTKAIAKVVAAEIPPRSIIGKMYQNLAVFGDAVDSIGFVSNVPFVMKLVDSTMTNEDHISIYGRDLHNDEHAIFNSALDADFPRTDRLPCDGLLLFERTSLGLRDQGIFVTGRLVSWLEKVGRSEGVPIRSLYQSLFQTVVEKTGVTSEFLDLEDLYAQKSLCRADIEKLLNRASGQPRFLQSWSIVERELARYEKTPIQMIKIKSACVRYLRARASRESAAMTFVSLFRSGLAAVSDLPSCTSLMEVVEAVYSNHSIDFEGCYCGDDLIGALVVEAYEVFDG